ncbi:MAG TPA: hypothetical protein VN203_17045, partial [Candidatus Acidoferrum sp.]|nr:hypothetical protein [Candidatus Acidoferrum sp.]
IGFIVFCFIGLIALAIRQAWRTQMMLNEPEKFERMIKYEREMEERMRPYVEQQQKAMKAVGGAAFMGAKFIAGRMLKK